MGNESVIFTHFLSEISATKAGIHKYEPPLPIPAKNLEIYNVLTSAAKVSIGHPATSSKPFKRSAYLRPIRFIIKPETVAPSAAPNANIEATKDPCSIVIGPFERGLFSDDKMGRADELQPISNPDCNDAKFAIFKIKIIFL